MFDKIVSMLGGNVIDSVGKIIDNVTTTKEEKAKIVNDLEEIKLKFQNSLQDFILSNEQEITKRLESSHNMQIEALKQNDTFSKRFIYYLSISLIAFVAIFDLSLLFFNVPIANRDLINIIAGSLNSGALMAMLQFFYGSSSSSKFKDETIRKLS